MEPIALNQTGIIIVIGIIASLAFTAIVGFVIVIKRYPPVVNNFQGTRIWDFVILSLAGVITFILGLQGRLESEAIATIVGGMIGYAVGSYRSIRSKKPVE